MTNPYAMTQQEIFDRVWQHFIAEGKPPGLNEHGACVYRTAEGHRCAVGVLIPDGAAFTNLQHAGGSVEDILDSDDPIYVDGYLTDQEREWIDAMKDHEALLYDLQNQHDDAVHHGSLDSFTARIEDRLRDFAAVHNLRVPS